MADEIIAITMKYKPVPILNVVAETPELPHGETTKNPMPAPNDKSTSVKARDATAPANTAAHDTPGTAGSTNTSCAFCRKACSIKSSQQPDWLPGKCLDLKKVPFLKPRKLGRRSMNGERPLLPSQLGAPETAEQY